jgi:XRE family transcriptional regulator, master regulator for biofilm formation
MIGERIKRLRAEKKLTLSELAERSGVAKSYLSKIERHIQSNPSIQFLEKVAEALGVTMDDILYENRQSPAPKAALDEQWYTLIREAMESGVSKEQFREFLEFNKWKMGNH